LYRVAMLLLTLSDP